MVLFGRIDTDTRTPNRNKRKITKNSWKIIDRVGGVVATMMNAGAASGAITFA